MVEQRNAREDDERRTTRDDWSKSVKKRKLFESTFNLNMHPACTKVRGCLKDWVFEGGALFFSLPFHFIYKV